MIEVTNTTVYRSSVKGRRYLTLKAAIRAEAMAIITKKYPYERPEYENEFGRCTSPGWYWLQDMERADVLLRRMMRLVKASVTINRGQ